jgi:hypothetical protein
MQQPKNVRTALNCGVFTKFPFARKTILNTRWARAYLFRQLAIDASAAVLPKPYIPQFVFAAAVCCRTISFANGLRPNQPLAAMVSQN